MAEKQLYPVFEVPDFVTKKNEESRKQQYKPSVYFDYATGDFRLDGAGRMAGASGREAYMQWCIKTVMTERDAFLAYSTKYGAELETSLATTPAWKPAWNGPSRRPSWQTPKQSIAETSRLHGTGQTAAIVHLTLRAAVMTRSRPSI